MEKINKHISFAGRSVVLQNVLHKAKMVKLLELLIDKEKN